MHTAIFFAFTTVVTPIGGGNALTLPSQRRGVDRHGPIWLRGDDVGGHGCILQHPVAMNSLFLRQNVAGDRSPPEDVFVGNI
jgi:hypothetical protein